MDTVFAAAIPITISLTLAGFGIAYYYLTTRSRERLALIEKGLPLTGLQSRSYLPLLLLLGVLSVGIAAGIVAGAGLTRLVGNQSYVYPATIFLFAGLSLVVAYYLLRSVTTPRP
ncbi:DUF6249 domain-containing protein [Hymenobacter rigui]|uniref:DUF6249 domain-containing protein n=1 Tax=Hymenobacter rigui TaxID=334424 RepID=A0A428K9S8_9BACT|nr:DUF6249 domain-containing protein [Hymenobacter rigui]RSK43159.1 hypothetical protein EI291_22115 [Hymenobacter rigui]